MSDQRPSHLLERLSGRMFPARLTCADLEDGIVQLRLSTRLTTHLNMVVSPYLVDGVLLDTGFSLVRRLVADAIRQNLNGQALAAILLTHHHEDHTGNAAFLARTHGCPIYLHRPELRASEGVDNLLPYRRLYWGQVPPFQPQPMPMPLFSCRGRHFDVIPTPGHCATHVAFFERQSRCLFTGDILVSRGASAVMRHENPYQLVRSLRRAAAYPARRMLTGHGLVVENPGPLLRAKADGIERATRQVLQLHQNGLNPTQIRRRIFSANVARDHLMAVFTSFEFSRANFVRACLQHAAEVDWPSSTI